MITFRVICYGCRAKQINHTLSQLNFSSSHPAHISQTLILVFFSVYMLTGKEYSVRVKAFLLSELNEKPSQWVYLGYFQKLLLCHCNAKCSANSPRSNVPRMSCKLATDARLWQREIHFLSCNVPGKPVNLKVIIYLICSPNKLLTLVFVSQHVSPWFVIESQ